MKVLRQRFMPMKCATYLLVLLFLMINIPKIVYATNVVIDGSIKYQTIDGWGINHYIEWNWEGPDRYPIPEQDVMYQIKNDLGVGYIFNYDETLFTSHEQKNDNSDPFNYNWSSYNSYLSPFNTIFKRLQVQQNAGLKYVLASLAKPAWMGDAGGNFNSNIPNIYDELAEYWTSLFIYARTNFDLNIPYIIIQREANFSNQQQGWSGFTAEELGMAIEKVGSRFRQEGFETKIIAPDEESAGAAHGTNQIILNRPLAKNYMNCIAFHAYDGFSGRDGPDLAIPAMTQLANDNLVRNSGLPIWLTEWTLAWAYGDRMGDWVDTLRLALDFAKMVHNAHVFGNVSLYVIWTSGYDWGIDINGDGIIEKEGIFGPGVTDGKLNLKKYGHVLSQYTKYIPPGSKRIDAALAGAQNVFVTAYRDDNSKRFTIEFINKNTNSQTVNINIKNILGISGLDVIRTSETENAAHLGQVSVVDNSLTYSLPGESVTTFTGFYSPKTNTISANTISSICSTLLLF